MNSARPAFTSTNQLVKVSSPNNKHAQILIKPRLDSGLRYG